MKIKNSTRKTRIKQVCEYSFIASDTILDIHDQQFCSDMCIVGDSL